MKITTFTPLVALLLFFACANASTITAPLGTSVVFNNMTDVIQFQDSNGADALYLTFQVTRGCGKFSCNITAAVISGFTIPSGSNFPASSQILSLGFGQAVNITVYPDSILLANFTLIFPQLAQVNGSFSGLMYDANWGQFGVLTAYTSTAGTSVLSQSDYLTPNIFLVATINTTAPTPLFSSQYYYLNAGQKYSFALSSNLFLTLTTAYDNMIRIFQTKYNTAATSGPTGYTVPKNWYNVQMRDPYYTSTGAVKGNWRYPTVAGSPNGTIFSFNGLFDKNWDTFVWNQTRLVNGTNVNSTFTQLAGTWGFYTVNSGTNIIFSTCMISFMLMLALLV